MVNVDTKMQILSIERDEILRSIDILSLFEAPPEANREYLGVSNTLQRATPLAGHSAQLRAIQSSVSVSVLRLKLCNDGQIVMYIHLQSLAFDTFPDKEKCDCEIQCLIVSISLGGNETGRSLCNSPVTYMDCPNR